MYKKQKKKNNINQYQYQCQMIKQMTREKRHIHNTKTVKPCKCIIQTDPQISPPDIAELKTIIGNRFG